MLLHLAPANAHASQIVRPGHMLGADGRQLIAQARRQRNFATGRFPPVPVRNKTFGQGLTRLCFGLASGAVGRGRAQRARRIRQRREQLSLSQEELAARMGYRSKSSITKLEKGVNDIPQSKVEEFAAALETTPAWLMGLENTAFVPPGFEPLPEMVRVPLVGSIACGSPITAEQNIECYIGVPAAWHADFALTCHGSSMAPTICDGDIVCIRCQPEVEQGEIAAVRIGDEATLKHFHRQGDTVMLLADNAAVCPPMIYAGPQLNEIQIEGRAVGFCRGL